MAKTLDLSTVSTVSANSGTKILVESSNGNIGYVANVFTDGGKLAEVPDHETFATKEELNKYQTIASANSTYAVKTDLNQYIKILIEESGSSAYMNNEANGGLIKLTTSDKKMSKVTLYDGSDDAQTRLQLVVKDESSDDGQVARINGKLDGFYYLKTKENNPLPEHEIATIGDVDKRTVHVLPGTADGDISKIQNQNDGGVMQYVTKEGANNAVCVNNGSGETGIGVELCALQADGHGTRLMVNDHGAYLTVADDTQFTNDNMIVTKKDIAEIQKTIKSLQSENKSLKTQLAKATDTVNEYTAQVSQLIQASTGVVQASETANMTANKTKS